MQVSNCRKWELSLGRSAPGQGLGLGSWVVVLYRLKLGLVLGQGRVLPEVS